MLTWVECHVFGRESGWALVETGARAERWRALVTRGAPDTYDVCVPGLDVGYAYSLRAALEMAEDAVELTAHERMALSELRAQRERTAEESRS